MTPTPVPMLAISLCAILREGTILLLRRAKPPYQGLYSLPGGKIHPGESVTEAACREALEETGLRCHATGVCGVATETITHADGSPQAHFLMYLVRLNAEAGEPQPGVEGELAWFPLTPPPEAGLIPTDAEMIRRYVLGGATFTVDHYDVQAQEGDSTSYHLRGIRS